MRETLKSHIISGPPLRENHGSRLTTPRNPNGSEITAEQSPEKKQVFPPATTRRLPLIRKHLLAALAFIAFTVALTAPSMAGKADRINFDLNLPLSLLGEGASTIFRQFESLHKILLDNVELDIELNQPGSWKNVIDRLERGDTDIAWLPPYFYARARTMRKNSKIRPLVIYRSSGSIKSPVCIYAKPNSGLSSVENLLASRIAFPDEDSWVALNRIFAQDKKLAPLGIDPLHFFTGFHILNRESSVEALQFGMVDAVVLEPVYREYLIKKSDRVKKTVTVACTEPLPNTLLVYRDNLDTRLVETLKIILTNMHRDPYLREFRPYFKTTDGEWEEVEDKDLKPWFDIYNESIRNGWDKDFRTLPSLN
jgi:ABC-type phosphate/phosphonate transport system substrate-binding protein